MEHKVHGEILTSLERESNTSVECRGQSKGIKTGVSLTGTHVLPVPPGIPYQCQDAIGWSPITFKTTTVKLSASTVSPASLVLFEKPSSTVSLIHRFSCQ